MNLEQAINKMIELDESEERGEHFNIVATYTNDPESFYVVSISHELIDYADRNDYAEYVSPESATHGITMKIGEMMTMKMPSREQLIVIDDELDDVMRDVRIMCEGGEVDIYEIRDRLESIHIDLHDSFCEGCE